MVKEEEVDMWKAARGALWIAISVIAALAFVAMILQMAWNNGVVEAVEHTKRISFSEAVMLTLFLLLINPPKWKQK